MAKGTNALQKIESHEKLCRIMQKQTHDKILKLETQINRIESILLVSVGALIEAAVDFILIETVFDTLNAKAALMAISSSQEAVKNMCTAFEKRRDLICERFDDIDGVTYVKPQGAFYIFPDFSDHYNRTIDGFKINGSQDLANFLLDSAKVGVVPGDGFGADKNMRLSFATSETEINRGLDRIKEALNG